MQANEPNQDDLFAQVVDATKKAIDGAGDAYREAFQDVQDRLPTFDEVLAQAIRLPGTGVNRTSYLTEVIGRKHAQLVRQAIETTPARAGLSPRDIEKIAKKSLGKDGRRTTALSFAAGIPGGVAGAVTIPADLVQFYGYLVRSIQKLTYLYGWRDLVHVDASQTDVATASALVILLGVMAGVRRADDALARLARLRASVADAWPSASVVRWPARPSPWWEASSRALSPARASTRWQSACSRSSSVTERRVVARGSVLSHKKTTHNLLCCE